MAGDLHEVDDDANVSAFALERALATLAMATQIAVCQCHIYCPSKILDPVVFGAGESASPLPDVAMVLR